MINPFERFYDTEIEIYRLTDGGYSNGDTKTYLGKIICDLQPYRDETQDAMRGLSSDRQYKIYSDKYPIIKNGNLVLFGGAWYRIICTEEWSFGTTAVMRCIDDEN